MGGIGTPAQALLQASRSRTTPGHCVSEQVLPKRASCPFLLKFGIDSILIMLSTEQLPSSSLQQGHRFRQLTHPQLLSSTLDTGLLLVHSTNVYLSGRTTQVHAASCPQRTLACEPSFYAPDILLVAASPQRRCMCSGGICCQCHWLLIPCMHASQVLLQTRLPTSAVR